MKEMMDMEMRSRMLQSTLVPGPMTTQGSGFPVDAITKPSDCTLQFPFGRSGAKKDVGAGQAHPPQSGAMFNGKPIPPDYCIVHVFWTKDEYDEETMDYPTVGGRRLLRDSMGTDVLWNKADIVLELPKPSSTLTK